jgi:4-hydroxy-tetrahydrodipicolinate synthase
MTPHDHLRGVYAAALTPMHDDFSLALDALPGFLDFLARRGCHGTLLLGTTGEGPSLSPTERSALLSAALEVRQAWPDFRLLAGTGTPSLDETVELTRHAFDLGMDGVVILPPYYYRKVADDGLLSWFSQVMRRGVPAGGSVFGYHIPGITGVPLSLDLLSRLKDEFPGQFAGVKDSSTDAGCAQQLGERFGADLLVFSGTDSLFSLALENAAGGCITALANLCSSDLRRVWDAHAGKPRVAGVRSQEGASGVARQSSALDIAAQERLSSARALMDRYPPNPPLYKAMLARLYGFPRWAVRPPLLPLNADMEEKVLQEARTVLDDRSA